MQNLSDDEKRDIEELVSSIIPEKSAEEDQEVIKTKKSNGESVKELEEPVEEKAYEQETNLPQKASIEDLIKLSTLQNERLGILNKKVDVLTRLVELILRANLEDVE